MGGIRMRLGIGGIALAVLLLACGGGEEPAAESSGTVQPMAKREASAGNRPPEVVSVALRPNPPGAGQPVKAVVEVEDPDGDRVTLGFVWLLNGEVAPSSGPMLMLPHALKGDTLELRVTASDGREETTEELSVQIGNRAPRLKGLEIDPGVRITSGGPLSVTPMAEDPDGDVIEFEYTWWVNERRIEEEGPTLDTNRLKRGDRVQVRVVATDGEDESEAIVSQEIEVINAAPRIVSMPSPTGADGVFHYPVEVEDVDGGRGLRFQLEESPPGMSIDRLSGLILWTPREDQAGSFPVLVVVEDPQGGRGTQRFEVTVGVEEVAPESPPAAPGR